MIESMIAFRESPPASPEPRKRGSLSGLFGQLSFKDKRSDRVSRRKSKPLPPTPPDESVLQTSVQIQPPVVLASNLSTPTTLNPWKPLLPDIKTADDIKRICIPEESSKLLLLNTIPGWTKVKTTDSLGLQEMFYYHQETHIKIRGCCAESQGILGGCTLCDHENWIFHGSEYNPEITLLYSQMDGCIPASVKLVNPKFIIPWRYKNRKSGKVSWKIIHMCGTAMDDAECETIVVNMNRDKKLRRIIETVKKEAVWY
jgi:hypothetical protein